MIENLVKRICFWYHQELYREMEYDLERTYEMRARLPFSLNRT